MKPGDSDCRSPKTLASIGTEKRGGSGWENSHSTWSSFWGLGHSVCQVSIGSSGGAIVGSIGIDTESLAIAAYLNQPALGAFRKGCLRILQGVANCLINEWAIVAENISTALLHLPRPVGGLFLARGPPGVTFLTCA